MPKADQTPEEKRAAQISEDLRRADEQRKADAARKDEANDLDDHGHTLNKMLSCMDAMTKRLDAFEARQKAREDAEMDHGHQSSFGKESDAHGDPDAPREDPSSLDPDERELLETERREPGEARPVVADMRDKKSAIMAHAQSKCDAVASAFSRSAPRPLDGESIRAYRIRLLQPYKANSSEYVGVGDDILKALPPAVFGIAETKIYADSIAKARNPNVPEGELWPVYTKDQAGRTMTEWRGQPRTWMSMFSVPPRRVIGIRNHT
jgi:hypothetical protein